MALTDIVTLDECKSWCKAADLTADQTRNMELIRKSSERLAKAFVGSSIVQATYTHYYPDVSGNRSDVLRMKEFPVRSITSVYEDPNGYYGSVAGSFSASQQLTAGNQYFLPLDAGGLSFFGHLKRRGFTSVWGNGSACWPTEPGSVKVTYVAGWSIDELNGEVADANLDASDIRVAILKAVWAFWQNLINQQLALKPGDDVSESLDGYSHTMVEKPSDPLVTDDLPPESKSMLKRFRRMQM